MTTQVSDAERARLAGRVLALVDQHREAPYRSIEWLGDQFIALRDRPTEGGVERAEAFLRERIPSDAPFWSNDEAAECDRMQMLHWIAEFASLQAGEAAPVVGGWRSEVIAFANLMERQLRANDHKPGWKRDRADDLVDRVFDEAKELAEVVARDMHWGRDSEDRRERPTAEDIGREAADVANMAMMVADVCGALSTTPAKPDQTAQGVGNGWRSMEDAPRDGTRLNLCWKAEGGLDAHVELGKWSAGGWCNTYQKPFSGEPDYYQRLPEPPLSTAPHPEERN